MNSNTRLLTAGFALILAGMAVLVALFWFHINTISKEDQVNADLMDKTFIAYNMREAAEKRSYSLFQIITMDDYFDRDAQREKVRSYAGEFIAARSQLNTVNLTPAEDQSLDSILAAVRMTQPAVEKAIDLAVEEKWSPEVQIALEEALQRFTKVHEALNVFVAAAESAAAQRRDEIQKLRTREVTVIPTLGIIVFLVSLSVGVFVVRRELSHTKTLEQRVHERTSMLAERETHFRTIIETAADGIISTDNKGYIESFNPAAERIFGYSANEVMGRSVNMLMPMQDATHHDAYMHNYLDGGKPKVIGLGRELRAKRKDGMTCPIWLAVNRMKVGREMKFVGIVSDISAQKHAEDEARQLADDNEIVAAILRRSLSSDNLDKILQVALELILDRQNLDLMGRGAIFLHNTQSNLLEMRAASKLPNETMTRCATVKFGECLCGRAALDRVLVEKTSLDADHEIQFANQEDHGHLCMPITYGDQALGVMNLYLPQGHVPTDHERRLVTSVTDALAGVIHRHQNHEELVRAKESAEFASRTKTEFLANMSHELRTPLNAIIGYSEMMETEVFGPVGSDKYKEYLTHITGSGRHLYGLINDILDVSRIETHEFPITDEDFSLKELIEESVGTVRHRAEGVGNTVKVDVLGAMPTLRADKRRLKQVLINLLHNAIKFTPAGGTISLSTQKADDGGFKIYVVDTGIGIAEKDIETVFAMFGQVDGSLARKYDGVGLGLPLSRKLVEKHGGQLELRSTPDMGTTAIISLPAERVIWN